MIHGFVNDDLDPVVRLKLLGPLGIEIDLDLVVDTGFSGTISIPLWIIEYLGLSYDGNGDAVLADGVERT